MISIIVPCYNSGHSIEKCLVSIMKQKYTNFEVIIIDDGSFDNTKEIVSNTINKDSRFTYYYQKNAGVSTARNFGLEKSKGKYIAFIDSDDVVKENYLKVLVENIEKSSSSLSVCAIDRGQKIKGKEIPHVFELNGTDKILEEILIDDNIGGYLWNKLFVNEIIKFNNLLLNPSIHFMEDILFCTEYILHMNGTDTIVSTEKLYKYLETPNSITNVKLNEKKITGIVALEEILFSIEKNGEKVNNLYYERYAYFLISVMVNAREENIIDKNEIKKIVSKIKKIDIRRITSSKVKYSILMISINSNLYYFFWKLLKRK